MNHLTRNDYAGALRLLARLEAQAGDLESFARASVAALGEFVACELATLSVRDLVTGHRQVVGLPGQRTTHRISDALSRRDFHRSALYAEYYRCIGFDYVVVVPLFMDGRTLVSIVLNRRGLDFSERERERLDLLRPHLAFLYRQACRAAESSLTLQKDVSLAPLQADPLPEGLTLREGEVMRWLSCGKTDAEIAALLAISPRTVQKHLEHIYVKLGVETRTAAVMRSLAMCSTHSVHEKGLQRPSIMRTALLNK